MEAEELNPFSFREFLRWKNQDPDPEQARTEVRAAQLEVHLCPKAASTNTEWVCAHSCVSQLCAHVHACRVYMCIFKSDTNFKPLRCGGRGCDRCGPSV